MKNENEALFRAEKELLKSLLLFGKVRMSLCYLFYSRAKLSKKETYKIIKALVEKGIVRFTSCGRIKPNYPQIIEYLNEKHPDLVNELWVYNCKKRIELKRGENCE